MERVPMRLTTLETRNPYLILLEIPKLHEGRLTSPKTVAIDEIKQEEIAHVLQGNRGEEALNLILRKVLDRTLFTRTANPRAAPPTPPRGTAFPLCMNGDSAGNPSFH
jgi:hypothetical protein